MRTIFYTSRKSLKEGNYKPESKKISGAKLKEREKEKTAHLLRQVATK